MRIYKELLSRPGVNQVLWSQLLARFAFGMQTITIIIHLERTFDNYSVAGLAIGASTVGGAVAAPILGQWMAKIGIRPIILVCTLLAPIFMLLIGFFPMNQSVSIFYALLLGLTLPPIQPAARAVYPTLVENETQRNALYSVDAILQEIIWIVGPVLATLMIAFSNTLVPIITMAAIQLVGGLWFISLQRVTGAPIPRSRRKLGAVLKSKLVIVMIAINLLFVGSFSALEIGAVAAVGAKEAGFVIAMLSIGSVVGGLAFGHRVKSSSALTKQLAIVLVGDLLIFFNAKDPLWLGICLFISGIGVATAFATIGAIIGKAVKLDDTTEVYGWIGSGQNIGYGLGAAIAGFVVDHFSSTHSFALAAGLDFVAMLVAAAAISITPNFIKDKQAKE
ncbi:MAG: MFS transporter [Rhodoluna sp.]|jgi:MFS family permease